MVSTVVLIIDKLGCWTYFQVCTGHSNIFMNCLFRIFLHIFQLVYLSYRVIRVFLLHNSPLSNKCFLSLCGYVSHFFRWFLLRSGSFKFFQTSIYPFFNFIVNAFCIISNISLPARQSWTFSPRNFIGVGFIFRAKIHLELFYVHCHIFIIPSDCYLGLLA